MTTLPLAVHLSAHSDTVLVGGDLPIRRLGLGSMQLTGPGHWGRPAEPERAKQVLRRAVALGVNHIDTADAYGPHAAECLIRKALHPYASDLVIATKGGMTRQGPNQWSPVGRPEYLRQCVEMSLRRLQLDCVDLYYLHRIDPAVPLADQLGVLAECQAEGKIRHIGLSKVSLPQVEAATKLVDVAAVQNRLNVIDQSSHDVLRYCEDTNTVFVPYAPLGAGELINAPSRLSVLAAATGLSAATLALALLLQKSPVMAPIPGTASVHHLEQNMAAAATSLRPDELTTLLGGTRITAVAR